MNPCDVCNPINRWPGCKDTCSSRIIFLKIGEKTPCKNCVRPIRHYGCHDNCECYLADKERRNEIVKAKIEEDSIIGAIVLGAKRRLKAFEHANVKLYRDTNHRKYY